MSFIEGKAGNSPTVLPKALSEDAWVPVTTPVTKRGDVKGLHWPQHWL